MAKFVSQEAYDRASLSARDQSHALAVRDRTRALFPEQIGFVRFPVGELSTELSHLFKQAFMQRLSWLWWYGSY